MLEVVSTDTMRRSDAAMSEKGVNSKELMCRAGQAIFETVRKLNLWKPPVAVICGPGNNGGDGYALASLLNLADIDCVIFALSDKVTETSRPFLDAAIGLGTKMTRNTDELTPGRFRTVVDCIFGTGFKGAPKEPYLTAIRKINESGAYIISVDINSGLGGDSGIADGEVVRSDLTVSIGCRKSGLYMNYAKDYIKKLVNCDIGIDLLDEPARLVDAPAIKRLFVREEHNTNKGDFGYVALIGGSPEYSGAAKLANLSLSALRSGAGVAKLAVPKSLSDAVLPYILESTLFPLDDRDGKYVFNEDTAAKLLSHTRAAAIGMGMGRSDEVAKLIDYVLTKYDGRLIIDADGLNTLAGMGREKLKNAACRVILTPHPKEFERISGIKFEEFRYDIPGAAKRFAEENNVILLLKGAATVITDGKSTYIVDRGCTGMSTAGSGDVLSGILAGICGYVKDEDLTLGVAAGAYLNGRAGELAQENISAVSMLSGDTVAHIPDAVREILAAGDETASEPRWGEI